MNTKQDDFQVIQSKPLTGEERARIYVSNSFVCPVCLQSGGPTFGESGTTHEDYVVAYGLSIPSNHVKRCLPIAAKAFQYFRTDGKVEGADWGVHNLHLGWLTCMHAACVADRLWRNPQ